MTKIASGAKNPDQFWTPQQEHQLSDVRLTLIRRQPDQSDLLLHKILKRPASLRNFVVTSKNEVSIFKTPKSSFSNWKPNFRMTLKCLFLFISDLFHQLIAFFLSKFTSIGTQCVLQLCYSIKKIKYKIKHFISFVHCWKTLCLLNFLQILWKSTIFHMILYNT